jgi:bifunctional non-homologous end joining protein LigD
VIPERQYGAGSVLVWDRGAWKPEGDATKDLARGKIDFELWGEKLRGRWTLVRMPRRGEKVDRVPGGDRWLHEPKLDGYRVLCRIDRGRVMLRSRNEKDWTDKLSAIAAAAKKLPVRAAILDGEAVVLDENGVSRFQLLQNAMSTKTTAITYFAFDLLHLDGWDLRGSPLRARKERLRVLLADGPLEIRYTDHIEGRGEELFGEACKIGLEGLLCKRADDPYREARTRSWLKVKCHKREELVVVGFTDPGGSRVGFGALVLGTRDRARGPLRFAGRVGTSNTVVMLNCCSGHFSMFMTAVMCDRVPFVIRSKPCTLMSGPSKLIRAVILSSRIGW